MDTPGSIGSRRAEPFQSGKAGSLHERIVSDITARIVSGKWRPGHRIPFEHELATEYDCSRMTVNKALGHLARSGLIERRRRSGSFVRRPHSQAAILEIHDIRSEVEALGLPYRYQLLAREVRRANSNDRRRLGTGLSSRLLETASLHFAGERPFCHENRLISLDVVPDAEIEGFDGTAPGPWLVGKIPWSVAEHRIHAASATPALAAVLDIPHATPCLVVERQTWSAEQPVTQVRFTYPGDGHVLVARFSP